MFLIKYFWRRFTSKISKLKLKKILMVAVIIFLGATIFVFFRKQAPSPIEYIASSSALNSENIPAPKKPPVHILTPKPVKGIYMTSWVAGTKDWRESMVKLIEETELNSIVIDVKDYSGHISFEVSDPVLKEIGASEKRIPDIIEFINYLHQKNIYVIARISTFQDAYLVSKRPDLAVKRKDGTVWKDYKGIAWLNPASHEVWDYIVRVAKESESVGFDELNFDYIRYPSDGDMKNIVLPYALGTDTKAESLKAFFVYLSAELAPLKILLSVDLFGFTTTHSDDLNIGQILENAAPYFDYISPMVYPSHYPKGYENYSNPADHPYEVISLAMKTGSAKLIAATSSPSKLRPWLQSFNLGAVYTAEMIRKEKQAVYDSGLDSWMLWDPANKYIRASLDNK